MKDLQGESFLWPFRKNTPSYSDTLMRACEAHGVVPGTVVVDDKWAAHYATCRADEAKWPDLRGWIAERHAAGIVARMSASDSELRARSARSVLEHHAGAAADAHLPPEARWPPLRHR